MQFTNACAAACFRAMGFWSSVRRADLDLEAHKQSLFREQEQRSQEQQQHDAALAGLRTELSGCQVDSHSSNSQLVDRLANTSQLHKGLPEGAAPQDWHQQGKAHAFPVLPLIDKNRSRGTDRGLAMQEAISRLETEVADKSASIAQLDTQRTALQVALTASEAQTDALRSDQARASQQIMDLQQQVWQHRHIASGHTLPAIPHSLKLQAST